MSSVTGRATDGQYQYHCETQAVPVAGDCGSRTDQGQAQRLGVKYFPAMMLVDPKQGSVRPLSYGFISQDDLAKQFLNVSEDFKPNF